MRPQAGTAGVEMLGGRASGEGHGFRLARFLFFRKD